MTLKKDNAIVKLKARVLANRIATVTTMLLSLATSCVVTQPAAAYPVELIDCYKTKTIVTPEGVNRNDLNLILEDNLFKETNSMDLSKGRSALFEIDDRIKEFLK